MGKKLIANILTSIIAFGSLATSGVAGYKVIASKLNTTNQLISSSPSPLPSEVPTTPVEEQDIEPEQETEEETVAATGSSPIPFSSSNNTVFPSQSPKMSSFPAASLDTKNMRDDEFEDEDEDELEIESHENEDGKGMEEDE